MTVKLERDMSMDPIIELGRKLKEARVDRERQEPCMDRNRARRAAMRSSSLYTEVHGGVVNQQA